MTSRPDTLASPVSLPSRRGVRAWLQRGGAGLVVGIALGDMLRSRNSAFGQITFGDIVPMSPTTEWVIVLLGIALALQLFFPTKQTVRRVAVGLSALAAAIALHVLYGHFTDRMPSWEGWLGSSDLIVKGFPVGHMSTQAAVLSLFSNFALFALFSPPTVRKPLRDAGIFAAVMVELFALMTVVSYAAGNPPVTSGGWLKMAPLPVFEFTTFNFVLLMGGTATNRMRQWFFGTDVDAPDFAPVSREERLVISLLAGVGLMALSASLVYLRSETSDYQLRSIEVLQRMADLKVGQIEQWRSERLGDARTLMRMPRLAETVRSLTDGPAVDSRRSELAEWLRQFAQNYNYTKIIVLNRAMEPVLSEPGEADLSATGLREQLRALRPNSDAIELPAYVDGAGLLRWDLLVPLRSSQSTALDGAILLQTNPTRFIIPILQSWPTEYRTGQSVLWYRDGDRLISLGGYRPAPGTLPEELRPFGMIRLISKLPPDSLPARVVRGETDAGEGLDYRGVTIIGLGRIIKNSPWLFSSRLDSDEVYAPLRQQAIVIAGIVAGLFATTGFTTSWLWRQRQNNLLHDRLTAELEQKRATARLGLVMRHANDMIFLTDENRRLVDANQQAVDTYGWTKEEILRLTTKDLRAPEAMSSFAADAKLADTPEGAIYETVHRRKDGTTFPVEISVRRVKIEGERQVLSIIRDISERRQAEAKLRDSEEKFSKAFRANPSGIAITDLASGRFIEVNESYCRIMGHASQDVVGRTSVELGVWGSGEERREMFRTLFDGGVLRNFEMQVRARDGEAKTVLVNAELIELNGQRCVLSLIEDITDRKRAEAALRASEERYRLIADNTSDLIWLYDRTADRFTYASPSALPLLGYTPEEIVGRKLLDFIAPVSEAAAQRALEQALKSVAETRAPVHLAVELEHRRKDGSVVPMEVVTSVLADAMGRVTHILGVTRDITERQKARETLEKFNTELEQQVETRTAELAARNREIEALVESIPDTVLLCDERGELITSHFAQNRASAFPFASVSNGDRLSQQHPVLLEIARELHAVSWASQEAIMLEFDRNINGVDYSIEARATPAGVNRLLILMRDISARKRGERVAQANLERERQLSDMKSQFISVASHEFRTPLAAAVGSLELLERHHARLTDAKRTELLVRAQRSLGRLTGIMTDVLQVSRADSGRVKVKLMNVDLGRFVQDVVNEVAEGDRQAHTFSFEQSGGPSTVPADTNLLNHVISNLVGNAARYSPTGTKVSVTLHIEAEAFIVTVADEGIGIPEAERERIFEPFVRGSNVGQIGGTGLGLNIVKRYTELMGGHIVVLPTERGATFRIRVPCTQPAPS